MAAATSTKPTTRSDLLAEVMRAARRNSTLTVMFHGAIAEKFGLIATDMKAMEVLDRLGALTAGDIAKHTGLAPASVTDLVDRLEARGFVRRVRDRADRRRVIVELDPKSASRVGGVYDALGRAAARLFASYSSDQLAVVADFLGRGTDMVLAQLQKLTRENGRRR